MTSREDGMTDEGKARDGDRTPTDRASTDPTASAPEASPTASDQTARESGDGPTSAPTAASTAYTDPDLPASTPAAAPAPGDAAAGADDVSAVGGHAADRTATAGSGGPASDDVAGANRPTAAARDDADGARDLSPAEAALEIKLVTTPAAEVGDNGTVAVASGEPVTFAPDEDADRPAGDVVLRLTDVVKTFPGVRALDGVQLEVRAGEVHCLLGQNGAGKSTLIKILSGAHRPDEGKIEWLGDDFAPANPQAAMKAGIATIYQELDLVDDLSVAENAFLGHEPRVFGFVRRGYMARHTREILARLGHAEIPPRTMVRSLPAAGKQVVSMARALSHDARLIIMDEPSAVLAHDEVANLFRIIRELTAAGIAVIYISHRLEEIREIGDRVTVLKDGRTTAANLPARTTPTRDLVSRMTGRTIEYIFPDRPEPVEGQPELLRVENLGRAGEFVDVSLSVHAGEIVGIAGLVGSGRSELLETIFGARQAETGRVLMEGKPIAPGRVGAAVRAGMGMAPEERKSQALLLGEPIYRNITLSTFARFGKFGFTDAGEERKQANRVADSLELRPRDVRRPVRTLSGGNQQKVVVGRWLLGGTKLLLLDEPTRGVDVGARAELYQVIRGLAAQGVGVLLVSSEVPEVLGLADRVVVMREGRVVRQAPADQLDEDTVLDLVMSGSLMEGAPA